MSKNKNPQIDDPLHTIFARYELANTRTLTISVVVNLMLLIGMSGLLFYSLQQNRLIEYLSTNRIMYGFATGDGSFASVDQRPESMIVRYAREALYNTYNYDKDAIVSNYEAVLAMYAHQVREPIRARMGERIQRIRREDLSQSTTVMGYKMTEHPDRYVIEFDSVVRQYILDNSIGRNDLIITVTLQKVAPTESRREGLAMLSIADKPFVRDRRVGQTQ